MKKRRGLRQKSRRRLFTGPLVDTIKVPEKDNFQVIIDHASQNLIYDPSYLDMTRTDGIIFIQINVCR